MLCFVYRRNRAINTAIYWFCVAIRWRRIAYIGKQQLPADIWTYISNAHVCRSTPTTISILLIVNVRSSTIMCCLWHRNTTTGRGHNHVKLNNLINYVTLKMNWIWNIKRLAKHDDGQWFVWPWHCVLFLGWRRWLFESDSIYWLIHLWIYWYALCSRIPRSGASLRLWEITFE